MGLISNGTTIFDNGTVNAGGSMKFIKKLTASSSATLSFVDGSDGVVLDDTYKEYMFTFKDIHPQTDDVNFSFQVSTDGGSTYSTTVTSTEFIAQQRESDSTKLEFKGGQAQGTNFQGIFFNTGSDADQNGCGTLQIFNPSSDTFVKHFIGTFNNYHSLDRTTNFFIGGYFNTTNPVDAVQFKFSSGNIDAGDICLYGIA